MDFKYEENRIYLENEKNKIIAEICFENIGNNTYNITHTVVDPEYRGKNIASGLVEEAVKYIKSKNGKIEASCSYAKKWLEKNNIK